VGAVRSHEPAGAGGGGHRGAADISGVALRLAHGHGHARAAGVLLRHRPLALRGPVPLLRPPHARRQRADGRRRR
jgi:hypothetical protein